MSVVPVTKAPGAGKKPTRLRLSTWSDPRIFLDAVLDPPKGSKPQGVKPGTELDHVVFDFLDQSAIVNGLTILDDVSLQRTILHNPSDMTIDFDPIVYSGFPKLREQMLQKVIDGCHQRRIQCLAGYAFMGGAEASSFNQWLKGQKFQTLSEQAFAKRIVDFLNQHLPKCDGLSFDIEGVSTELPKGDAKRNSVIAQMATKITTFYQEIAKLLNADGKLLAVTVGGLIDGQGHALRHFPPSPAANLKVVAVDYTRIHRYEMATKASVPLLIRPMAYDSEPQGKDSLFLWHKDIIDYALRTVKVPKERFQLGVKITQGGGTGQGILRSLPQDFLRRCTDLLRKEPKGTINEVGIIEFATEKGHAKNWAAYNKTLNPPNGKPQAGIEAQPIQITLSKTAAARLKP